MHELSPTYEFYTDECCGQLSAEAFHGSLAAASRHVRWLVGNREPSEAQLTAYKRAVCAALDCFAEFGEGQVGGFSLGDFKVTHYEDEGTTGAEMATQAALKELAGTGLVFAGAR